jgi:hypothetical protein
VTFAGRLRGGYVPPRGKLVELQATDRGRWRTFALVRSGRSGAFRYRYRFSGSGRFAFRARVRFERAYPTSWATAGGPRSASAERRPAAGVARRARGRYPSAVDQ